MTAKIDQAEKIKKWTGEVKHINFFKKVKQQKFDNKFTQTYWTSNHLKRENLKPMLRIRLTMRKW